MLTLSNEEEACQVYDVHPSASVILCDPPAACLAQSVEARALTGEGMVAGVILRQRESVLKTSSAKSDRNQIRPMTKGCQLET